MPDGLVLFLGAIGVIVITGLMFLMAAGVTCVIIRVTDGRWP